MESVILSLVNRYSTEQKKDYFFKIIIKKAETKMHIELQQAYLCFICFLIPLLIIALFFNVHYCSCWVLPECVGHFVM